MTHTNMVLKSQPPPPLSKTALTANELREKLLREKVKAMRRASHPGKPIPTTPREGSKDESSERL